MDRQAGHATAGRARGGRGAGRAGRNHRAARAEPTWLGALRVGRRSRRARRGPARRRLESGVAVVLGWRLARVPARPRPPRARPAGRRDPGDLPSPHRAGRAGGGVRGRPARGFALHRAASDLRQRYGRAEPPPGPGGRGHLRPRRWPRAAGDHRRRLRLPLPRHLVDQPQQRPAGPRRASGSGCCAGAAGRRRRRRTGGRDDAPRGRQLGEQLGAGRDRAGPAGHRPGGARPARHRGGRGAGGRWGDAIAIRNRR